MIYWKLFLANLIANLLGYGGGPASVPLLEHEVVDRYHWYSVYEFSEMVAVGNALPGPIAPELAGYIGFDKAGVLGATVALFATIAPSLILLMMLLGLLMRNRNSPKVKNMTKFVRPAIAVLLAMVAFDFFANAYHTIGIIHVLMISIASFFLLERWGISPVYVICGALLYGAIFLR
ncbi:putative transporter YwrA [Weizmannia acidilactici]|uniref:chromate transporter n=1 Tax=Weizmannia acidilactici TaxID=2607726 RepID=UPI00124F3872|nr:chromate transporter [Weizmannia acidilactici]GER65994.1 putative transporter YwrA [Weizmannia acidilactici]